MKKSFFWIILIILFCLFLEGFSLVTLFLLRKTRNIIYYPADSITANDRKELSDFINNNTKYTGYSSELGWTIKKNGFSTLFKANSQGIRSNKEYSYSPQGNVLRISSFGDSFTHGDDVSNEETWQEKLNGANTDFEVINFGVSGFGLDQAYLRYRQDGKQYQSHIVLIGFMTENIFRNVNVYRPFYMPYSGWPFTKPVFYIKDNKLVLRKNPADELSKYNDLLTCPDLVLPELGANDSFYKVRHKRGFFDFLSSVRLYKIVNDRYFSKSNADIMRKGFYNLDSEAFQVTVKIFEQFYNEAIFNNSVPVIMIFPNRQDIIRYQKNKTKKYSPLIEYFKDHGYRYIDLMNVFDKYKTNSEVEGLFVGVQYSSNGPSAGVHYSSFGNELVAKYIADNLQDSGLFNKDIIMQELHKLETERIDDEYKCCDIPEEPSVMTERCR